MNPWGFVQKTLEDVSSGFLVEVSWMFGRTRKSTVYFYPDERIAVLDIRSRFYGKSTTVRVTQIQGVSEVREFSPDELLGERFPERIQ